MSSTASCLHCGGPLVCRDNIWRHQGDVAFPHAACPDKVNPANWR